MKTMILLACLCCMLFSCENVEKKAGKKLQTAREAFERGDFSEAKMQIDSIKILYPKAFETRREGISLMQQVELKEQEKTLVYLDSLLQQKQGELDALKGKFTLEKERIAFDHERLQGLPRCMESLDQMLNDEE